MSKTPMAIVVDAISGEVTERPLTADELTDREATAALRAEREAEAQAKANARQSALAKLAELGLTAEEIAAL